MFLPVKNQLVKKQQSIVIKSKENDIINNKDDKKIVIEKLDILKTESESKQAPPTPPQNVKPVVNIAFLFLIIQHFNFL
jgi:hypothetical protein